MERYSEYQLTDIEWLPQIPKHWKLKTLRKFLRMVSVKNHPEKPLLSVTRESGVIVRDVESKEENHNFIPEDLSGYKYVEVGDFCINKMKSWQGSYGVSEYEGIVSPAYYICKLNGVERRFFSVAIRSRNYVSFFAQYSKGIRVDQWDLSPIGLKAIPFFLPPVNEQHSIVSYLDTKCSQLDTLLSNKEKEISLLQEMKQRVIAEAVTRGINPNVKFKATNIPWLPEIPEHWELETLRNFLKIESVKNHSELPLLSVTREQGVIVRDIGSKEENHNFIPTDLSGYKYVAKGDFCINKMKSWQGSYGVSGFEGIVSPAYFVCKLSGVDSDFFSLAIRSKMYVSFFAQYSKGIRVDQWDLSPIGLRMIPFFLPPISEQRAIVSYITERTSKIDLLMEKLNKEIESIKEYKQRLISDVVTGQVKVC